MNPLSGTSGLHSSSTRCAGFPCRMSPKLECVSIHGRGALTCLRQTVGLMLG